MEQLIDIPATIREAERLTRAAQSKATTFGVADRHFICNEASGEIEEILPRFEDVRDHLETVEVIGVSGLVAWVQHVAVDPNGEPRPEGEIRLSRSSRSTAIWPRWLARGERRDVATMAFFDRFLPPAGWMSVEDFIAWTDKIRPGMSEEDRKALDVSLAQLTASLSEVTEVVQSGAFVSVRTENKQEAGKRPLPKSLSATIPFGDPEHETRVRWMVTVTLKDKQLRFRVAHDETDGAYEAWLAWARERMSGAVVWPVLVTP